MISKNDIIKMYKIRISTFVLYGCENWSLALMEEHKLMVFENRLLKKIFVPKRDEATGEIRSL
jgi:hypothetical protein